MIFIQHFTAAHPADVTVSLGGDWTMTGHKLTELELLPVTYVFSNEILDWGWVVSDWQPFVLPSFRPSQQLLRYFSLDQSDGATDWPTSPSRLPTSPKKKKKKTDEQTRAKIKRKVAAHIHRIHHTLTFLFLSHLQISSLTPTTFPLSHRLWIKQLVAPPPPPPSSTLLLY